MTDSLPGVPLDLPLPPALCETLGYRHDGRYVGFYQLEFAEDLSYTDGRSTGHAETWAFQSYKRHRAVAPLLQGVNLGSPERDAACMLVIDREANRAAVVPITEARAFLKSQWPEQPPPTPEQMAEIDRRVEAMITGGWREEKVDTADMFRAMAEQRGRVGRMLSFLEMCPDATERGRG